MDWELKFWSECILTTIYLINQIPSNNLNGKNPSELLFKAKPSYSHLRVFGGFAFSTTPTIDISLIPGQGSVFLGYPFGIKGYILLDVETQKTFISRNVVFHEAIFPYKTNATNTKVTNPLELPFVRESTSDQIITLQATHQGIRNQNMEPNWTIVSLENH